jgi:hydrogenase-4 component F
MPLTYILLTPLAAGLLCLAARPRWIVELLNLAAFSALLFLGVNLAHSVLAAPGGAVTEWREFLRADALSAWMVLLIASVSLASTLYAVSYFRRDLSQAALTERRWRQFYVLTPLFSAAMCLVVLANNLGVIWMAVEATALSSVLLVALYNRQTSLEAAWKYVMLGGLGLVLALFGTILTYAAAIVQQGREMPSFNWSSLLAIAPQLDHHWMKMAFIFVLVGYGTKAGLALMPFGNSWRKDFDGDGFLR